MCLVGGTYDATSRKLDLHFRESKSQDAYLMLFRSIAVTYGLPMAFYDLVQHFSVQEFRVVKPDQTTSHLGRTFRLEEKASLARQEVKERVKEKKQGEAPIIRGITAKQDTSTSPPSPEKKLFARQHGWMHREYGQQGTRI